MFNLIGHLFDIFFYIPSVNGLVYLYEGLKDFGLAIMLFVVLVRFILVPFTLQSLRSSKAMQELQPKIKELQEKYGKDREKLAAETMTLYKEHKVNPLASCLPILVQMPFLIGLFNALRSGVENDAHHPQPETINRLLYSFVPHLQHAINTHIYWFSWINHFTVDLAKVEPGPIHLLALLAGLTTLIQTKMAVPIKTAEAAKTSTDPQQQMMTQMTLMMPVITVFIAWNYPSGLALYWVTTTIFSIIQQYFVNGRNFGSLKMGWNISSLGSFLGGPGSKASSSGSKGDHRAPSPKPKGTSSNGSSSVSSQPTKTEQRPLISAIQQSGDGESYTTEVRPTTNPPSGGGRSGGPGNRPYNNRSSRSGKMPKGRKR